MRVRGFIVLFLIVAGFCAYAQKVTVNPNITPALFRYNDPITVTYDVTGTSLASLGSAYIWVWIPGKNIDAKYNINPATAAAATAMFTKTVAAGKTTFAITFKPSDFFATSISTETKLGILMKGADWSNGQSTDYLADIWDGGFQIKLTAPSAQPLFVNNGSQISIQAETPIAADYTLYVNNVSVDTKNGVTVYSYTHTVTETSGYAEVKLVAVNGTNSDNISFQYIISSNSESQPRPSGIIPGINYNPSDGTKVTLCLWAPNKSSVYVRGDFSNWDVLPENRMRKDGEFFWIELSGLTSGVEYGFQYLINETVYVADPYADKILDPDDQYIPTTVYPDLKSFPAKALSSNWYFNRLSVFQTNQPSYAWQVSDFKKPVKENLVVYELLVRDYFENGSRSYQNLIDTLSYLKRLGINAIELMPIMEFNGNESWGYNPTFMFAPDKYYGTKNKLKELVDECHHLGIAVILDIAMNHQDIPNPYVLMDFDFVNSKPTANNKWFNVTATHPYSVFYDMNHESSYTQAYLDTITHYWLNEFKADGFRFDLSKGFTQTNNPNNVDAWGQYDASRIAILKRMADKIWEHTPEAYIILEHFATNSEEKELAEYRIAEGKGMMLWGNLNNAYAQNTMGFSTSSDISWISHQNRGWSTPHVVGYMESHDEERLMYKNLQFGNSSGSYKVKTLATALDRMKAASLLFYTLPGPKMLWQFGELGYDYSINTCEDGTVNSNCRISPKPIHWEYQNDGSRQKLFNVTADLLRLRNTYPVFTQGDATIQGGNELTKQITIKNNPYTDTPTNADQMNVQVVTNLDVTSKTMSITFPHTGTWYSYYENALPLQVTSLTISATLKPGEYRLYTDFPIENLIVTGVEEGLNEMITLYPNPVEDVFSIELENEVILSLQLRIMQGACVTPTPISKNSWNVSALPQGLYVAEIQTRTKSYRIKVLKK